MLKSKGSILGRSRSTRRNEGLSAKYDTENDALSPTFIFSEANPGTVLQVRKGKTTRSTSPNPPRPSKNDLALAPMESSPTTNRPRREITRPVQLEIRELSSPAWASQDDPALIGVALGSPSHAPPPPCPKDSTPSEMSNSSQSGSNIRTEDSMDDHLDDIVRQRSGRGKWFAGLFGKKASSNPVSPAPQVYQFQNGNSVEDSNGEARRASPAEFPRHQAIKVDMKAQNTAYEPTLSPRHDRHQHNRKGKFDDKPDMRKVHSTPFVRKIDRGELSPVPPPKSGIEPTSNNQSRFQHDDGLMLQVDIPNHEMERYSVMFGKVLKPQQPSLMARRQAHISQLKAVEDTEEEAMMEMPKASEKTISLPQRASPPAPSSPSFFALFSPAANAQRDSSPNRLSPEFVPRPQQLQRSATVPHQQPSPIRSKFEVTTVSRQNSSPSRAKFGMTSSKDQDQVILMVTSPLRGPQPSVMAPKEVSDDTYYFPAPSPDEPSYADATAKPQRTDSLRPRMSKHPLKSSPPNHVWLTSASDRTLPSQHQNQSSNDKVGKGSLSPPPMSKFSLPSTNPWASISPVLPSKLSPDALASLSPATLAKLLPETLTKPPSFELSRPAFDRSASTNSALEMPSVTPKSRPSLPSFAQSAPAITNNPSVTQSTSTYFSAATAISTATGPISPTEISIARQISVSRRQRQLLVPIVPSTKSITPARSVPTSTSAPTATSTTIITSSSPASTSNKPVVPTSVFSTTPIAGKAPPVTQRSSSKKSIPITNSPPDTTIGTKLPTSSRTKATATFKSKPTPKGLGLATPPANIKLPNSSLSNESAPITKPALPANSHSISGPWSDRGHGAPRRGMGSRGGGKSTVNDQPLTRQARQPMQPTIVDVKTTEANGRWARKSSHGILVTEE